MIVVSGFSVVTGEDGITRALMGLRRPGVLRPSMWEYPGGKVNPGELHGDALRREWREELDVGIFVGELISTVALVVEEPIELRLYEVTIDRCPTMRDHEKLGNVAPGYAIRHLPCTPSTYLVYPAVRDFLARRGLR